MSRGRGRGSPKSPKMRKSRHKDSSESDSSSAKSVDLSCDAFVGNIPKHATKKDVEKAMTKFGKVLDVMLFDKSKSNPDIPKFAFVNFTTEQSALKAIDADGRIRIENNSLHTESRKPKGCVKGCIEEPNEYWYALLQSFDWKHSAAMYVFRLISMEDFLAQFIAIYASLRQKKQEKISELVTNLVRMADSPPASNLTETLPPHLAAMVHNMVEENKNGDKSINLIPILSRDKKKFRIVDDVVEYTGPFFNPAEALAMSNKAIVEGIFIYFFAKFNKTSEFRIKYPFYNKSEPIRTVLVTVTGQKSVNYALQVYFDAMKEVFLFDQETSMLKTTMDYFKKEIKEAELGPFKFVPSDEECLPTEVLDAVGIVKSLKDQEAVIEFTTAETVQTAVLKRDLFKSLGAYVHQDTELHFNAELNGKNTWTCRSAWIPGKEFVNLEGRITYMDKGRENGQVSFIAPDGNTNKANFDVKVFYDFKEEYGIDDVINLDVKPDNKDGFKATLIWIGSKPDEETMIKYDIEQQIEQILESNPPKATTDWNNNANFENLPECIQSVVRFGLDEDYEQEYAKKLIDQDILNLIFSELGLGEKNRQMFTDNMENETRKMLAAQLTKLK